MSLHRTRTASKQNTAATRAGAKHGPKHTKILNNPRETTPHPPLTLFNLNVPKYVSQTKLVWDKV